jgi:DNA anti-recombination protein RmuC
MKKDKSKIDNPTETISENLSKIISTLNKIQEHLREEKRKLTNSLEELNRQIASARNSNVESLLDEFERMGQIKKPESSQRIKDPVADEEEELFFK